MSSPLLDVRDLRKVFPIVRGGSVRRSVGTVTAVDGVSLTLARSETLGLVGESGCGKSTLVRCILRLIEPTSGEVIFAGQNIMRCDKRELRRMRPKLQIIFQDPYATLNPRMSVETLITEPMLVHRLVASRREARSRAAELLRLVGLRPEHAHSYPHAFSGGQRQRIGIARALATEPELLILDEPVSALDVSTRAQILELLHDLQARLGLALLFVAHDLSLVRYISDRVAVMYLGKIVETATRDELFDRPQHPYTNALLTAVPVPDPALARGRGRIQLRGEAMPHSTGVVGCRFRPRCPRAQSVCAESEPPLEEKASRGHATACFFPGASAPQMIRATEEVP